MRGDGGQEQMCPEGSPGIGMGGQGSSEPVGGWTWPVCVCVPVCGKLPVLQCDGIQGGSHTLQGTAGTYSWGSLVGSGPPGEWVS